MTAADSSAAASGPRGSIAAVDRRSRRSFPAAQPGAAATEEAAAAAAPGDRVAAAASPATAAAEAAASDPTLTATSMHSPSGSAAETAQAVLEGAREVAMPDLGAASALSNAPAATAKAAVTGSVAVTTTAATTASTVAAAASPAASAAAAAGPTAAADEPDMCLSCGEWRRRRQAFVCAAVHGAAPFSSHVEEQQEVGEQQRGSGRREAAASTDSSSEDEEGGDSSSSVRWKPLREGVANEEQQKLLLSRDTDIMYEQELQRDPFQVKIWCRYLLSKKEDPPAQRYLIYERAVSSLPGSYKLWWSYLRERVTEVMGEAATAAIVRSAAVALSGGAADGGEDRAAAATTQTPHSSSESGCGDVKSRVQRHRCEEVNKVFERALVLLLHMPKVWMFYLRFLQQQQLISRTRRVLDRALRSVAITQHAALWHCCMPFFRETAPVETTVRLYRRCVMLLPEETETFVEYLQQPKVGRYDQAAELLAEMVEDETRSSLTTGHGKTKHQLWLQLCDLVAAHPARIRSLNPEKVLRSGIARFSDEVGRLWCSLASTFLRLGEIEKARDIFEEAVQSVRTVQDLALVYDAYLSFEEGLLAAKIEQQQQRSRRRSAAPVSTRSRSKRNSSRLPVSSLVEEATATDVRARTDQQEDEREDARQQEEEEEKEIDYLMARLEYLTERRPLLVSSCRLRQNPHNVHEWLARAELFSHDPPKVVETFSEAVASVDPQLAVGRLSVLWLAFERFYEQHGDLVNARALFERAIQVPYRTVDELATVWCEYAEMLLRHGHRNEALQLVRRAINFRPSAAAAAPSQTKLYRSVKLWSLAADVEEMFGSLDTVRACYNKMFQLKTITPQLVINYAHFLEEHRFFEESFKVYERGIAAFRWPHLNDLWLMYLTKFVSRYGGQQLERARELFQQATADVPPRFARRLFLLYGKLEEEFGLAKHALSIYQAATKAVLDEEKKDMYYIYIARTTELFGIARTRKIYEEAIETLPEKDAREMCMRYALVERGLGEIDRSRAIYEHCSQFCDPTVHPDFWKAWKDFEVAHGNEDTFKDMLRVKRSVIAQYSQVHQNVLELAQGLVAAEEQQQAGQQLQQQSLAAAASGEGAGPLSSAELKRRAVEEQKPIEEELFYKKKRQMDEAELAQAQAEFQVVQRQRAQARVVSSLSADAPLFIAAQSFLEPRVGYVFKHGFFGLGYYLDEHQVGPAYYNAKVGAATTGPAPQKTTETAGKGYPAGGEEVNIELLPDVPEAVYGSLAAAAKEINPHTSTPAQQE